jgi:hypothetical protein
MADATQNMEKQFGINKIFRFAKKKNTKGTYVTEKKDLLIIEQKTSATVVKMEFTNTNCFILLSDGRVMSRGKDDCLGRANNESEGENKKFGEVLFTVTNDESEKSAIIYNISGGDEHVLALDSSSRVWGWGKNTYQQIHPKRTEGVFKKPILLTLPSDAKITQIFALQRTSMVVCKNNYIYMWGCIMEGYLGELKEKNENFVREYVKMNKVSTFILNDIYKNDENYTETFINSRKLFNTKYNQTLEDNCNKSSRIEKLTQQIENLKLDIELRQRQSKEKINAFNAINQDKSDKRIVLLDDLLKTYERKLNKITVKKDELRKELINIEEEINQKNIDLKGTTEQIDNVEDKIESFSNEVTELNASFKDGDTANNEVVKKNIGEKNKQLYNLKIYKESLMNNLQLIIVFLEEKEKERKVIADNISRQTDKENQYLKSRYVIEDMIMIIFESITSSQNNSDNSGQTQSSSTEKFKEKYIELFNFNDKLEKITFSELNNTYPHKIIEDILTYSNNELKNITKSIEITKASMSEIIKENLSVLFKMIDTKIELISEQNNMIKNLYNMLSNLQKEVKAFYTNDLAQRKAIEGKDSANKHHIYGHIEYLYKELIIKFFEDAHRGRVQLKSTSLEEQEKNEVELDIYLKEKQKLIKKLEERNNLYKEIDSKEELKNVVSFEYAKAATKKEGGSFFNWMGNK